MYSSFNSPQKDHIPHRRERAQTYWHRHHDNKKGRYVCNIDQTGVVKRAHATIHHWCLNARTHDLYFHRVEFQRLPGHQLDEVSSRTIISIVLRPDMERDQTFPYDFYKHISTGSTSTRTHLLIVANRHALRQFSTAPIHTRFTIFSIRPLLIDIIIATGNNRLPYRQWKTCSHHRGSKYTININTEMNYCCRSNCVPEMHQPLFDAEDLA